jgi:hypothetical protein
MSMAAYLPLSVNQQMKNNITMMKNKKADSTTSWLYSHMIFSRKKLPGMLAASLFAAGLLFATACSSGERSPAETRVVLTNDSGIDRTDEPVVMTREEIIRMAGPVPDSMVPLLTDASGAPVPSQADDLNRDGEWEELAFLIDIQAESTLELQISYVNKDEYPEFPRRTNVRFGVKNNSDIEPVTELELSADELPVPLLEKFQMDGPAWENDKIGFRQYIDGRNGRDLFGKTTDSMALEHVGIDDKGELVDNYHVLEPWGRDILAVGTSLGIGGIGILHNGTPVRLGITPDKPRNNVEMTRYNLVSEGPVRSVFTLTYEGWKVGNRSLDLENTVEIWAGNYRHTNTIRLLSDQATDTLVAGLVNIHNDEPLIESANVDAQWVYIATHDRQTYDKEHYLGMALILPAANYTGYMEAPESGDGITRSYNAMLEIRNNEPVTYYVLAGWELSDPSFRERSYFEQFLENEIQKISRPAGIQ